MTTYLLDSDVFIQAKNLHYGFDFCPAFWDWLDQGHQSGTVFSVESVKNELVGVADQLAAWAQARPPGFFLLPDQTTVASLALVSNWASSGYYEPAATNTFLQVADYYLVAQAHAGPHVVVSHEVPSASVRRIKVPDACVGVGVKFMNPYEMLRSEQARFVLA